jgi:hypothetical protein
MPPRTLFNLALLITLAVKLVLAWILPMSGDEAYFIVWARHPDYGFYDHPPMVGWWLQLLLTFGSSEVVLRLPAILLSTLIGMAIYRLLRPSDETRAALVATLFLVAPLNVMNVLVTTDTPLILFAFLSVASLHLALQGKRLAWYALSGAFFGMAFLSKYFAALLGLGYLAYFLFSGKDRQKTLGFVLLALAALPFALLNLHWNYTHCWDNVLFNFYTRNEGEEWSFGKTAIFLGTQIYLMTPPVIYYLYRRRTGLRRKFRREDFRLFACAFLAPMAVFALLSAKKVVGLHWVLAFYPFFYLLLHHLLSREELAKSLNFMAWFSAAHVAAIAVIAFLPMETWKNTKLYDGIVFMFKNEEIAEKIRPYEQQGFLLAADGYTPAAIVSYHYGRNFFVFGEGSLHARQDDMITDFRQFAGRNMLIVKKSVPDMAQYSPYFARTEVRQFTLRGVPFYLVLGHGFDYGQYREKVLRQIMNKYYSIPAFLPHAPCYFCEKYFPEECGSPKAL